MKIISIQKIIKVGSSRAVTLPARDLRAAGLAEGDEVEVTIKPLPTNNNTQAKLINEYENFKSEYAQALKNLAER